MRLVTLLCTESCLCIHIIRCCCDDTGHGVWPWSRFIMRSCMLDVQVHKWKRLCAGQWWRSSSLSRLNNLRSRLWVIINTSRWFSFVELCSPILLYHASNFVNEMMLTPFLQCLTGTDQTFYLRKWRASTSWSRSESLIMNVRQLTFNVLFWRLFLYTWFPCKTLKGAGGQGKLLMVSLGR